MTIRRTASRLALSALSTAPLLSPLLAQVPSAEVELVSTDANGEIQFGVLADLAAGTDGGWVAPTIEYDGLTPIDTVLVGKLSDDDPLGPRILRRSESLAGIDQGAPRRPRLGGGRVGYVTNQLSAPNQVGWLEDEPLVEGGEVVVGVGTVTVVDIVQPLTGGGALARVQIVDAGTVSLVALRYPGGSVEVAPGLPLLGGDVLQNIERIEFSPSGEHYAAIGTILPQGERALIVDGVVHTLRNGTRVVESGTIGAAISAAGPLFDAAIDDIREAFVTDDGSVVAHLRLAHSSGTEVDSFVFQQGVLQRRMEALGLDAELIGVDARGGVLTREDSILSPDLRLRFNGVPIDVARLGLDGDEDGIVDPGSELTFGLFGPPSEPRVSGAGRVYLAAYAVTPIQSTQGVLSAARKIEQQVVCEGAVNSTGSAGRLDAVGSRWVDHNRFTLVARGLPSGAVGRPRGATAAPPPRPIVGSAGPQSQDRAGG
ncbi:MAG: hypothetical protein AAFR54_12825, partial [Planctomycetota bacterium]